MIERRTNIKLFLVLLAFAVISAIYLIFQTRTQSILTDVADEKEQEQAISPDLSPEGKTYEIVTLLPPDAIPAISNPSFYSAEAADQEYAPEEWVIGVSINGESKAYSTSFLDGHEIVNDQLGGRKIAVTW